MTWTERPTTTPLLKRLALGGVLGVTLVLVLGLGMGEWAIGAMAGGIFFIGHLVNIATRRA